MTDFQSVLENNNPQSWHSNRYQDKLYIRSTDF